MSSVTIVPHRLMLWLSCVLVLLSSSLLSIKADDVVEEKPVVAPHVFISVLVTNSAYLLPNFFGYLEGLDYPKDRISIW